MTYNCKNCIHFVPKPTKKEPTLGRCDNEKSHYYHVKVKNSHGCQKFQSKIK